MGACVLGFGVWGCCSQTLNPKVACVPCQRITVEVYLKSQPAWLLGLLLQFNTGCRVTTISSSSSSGGGGGGRGGGGGGRGGGGGGGSGSGIVV